MTFGNGGTTFKAHERVRLAKKKPMIFGKIQHFSTKVRMPRASE